MPKFLGSDSIMSTEQFGAFCSRHFKSDFDTADHIGVGRMTIRRMRAGFDRGKPVPIPLWMALACAAYEAGIRDWDGGALQITAPLTIRPEAANG